MDKNKLTFRVLDSISETKVNLFKTGELQENQYNFRMVNKGLSQHADCLLYAQEMNCYYSVLSPLMQYDYLFASITKRRREKKKWAKSEESAEVVALMYWFKVSRPKAEQIRRVLHYEKVKQITQRCEGLFDGDERF